MSSILGYGLGRQLTCLKQIYLYIIALFNVKESCVSFYNKKTFFVVIFIFLWIFKNILISGCLIYPIEKTCIKILYWHNNSIDDAEDDLDATPYNTEESEQFDLSLSENILI